MKLGYSPYTALSISLTCSQRMSSQVFIGCPASKPRLLGGGVLCHWSGLLNVGIVDRDKCINVANKKEYHA
jgi:hypothetical protein